MTRREKDKAIYLIKSLIDLYVPSRAIEYSSCVSPVALFNRELYSIALEGT